MTPEEKFNSQIWEVLQDVKEQLLATEKGKPVKYRIPNVIGLGIMPKQRRIDLLYKLQEEKAFKIQRRPDGVRVGANDLYYLIINTLRFEEVYTKYSKIAAPPSPESVPVLRDTEIKLTPEILTADLKSQFEAIINEKKDDKFFIKIANFGKYIIEHNELDDLIQPLYLQSKEDVKNYKKACDAFWEEWKVLTSDLLQKAEEAGIKDDPADPLSNEIAELKGRLLEKPSYDEDYLGYYYRPYSGLIEKFKTIGKRDLIKDKHIKTGNESEYPILFDSYNKAGEEWNKFTTIRGEQIWWAHYQIMRLTYGALELEDKKLYFDNDNVIDTIYAFEFRQIAKGESTHLQIVRRNNFEEWIQRFYNYLLPRLKPRPILNIVKEAKEEAENVLRQNADSFIAPALKFQESVNSYGNFSQQIQEIEKAYKSLGNINNSIFPDENRYLIGAMKSPEQTVLERILLELQQSRKSESEANEVKEEQIPGEAFPPDPWELVEENKKPCIKKDGQTLYTFKTNWSNKYKYFEYMWRHYGQHIEPKELYEYKSNRKYLATPGENWKINKIIRDEIIKLKNETAFKKLPFKIELEKGYTFKIV